MEKAVNISRCFNFFLLIIILSSNVQGEDVKIMDMPKPKTKGAISVEEAVQKRRSTRAFSSKDISIEDISQLLWACQGITNEKDRLRAAPSAGALYPLEIYLLKKDGVLHYIPEDHKLEVVSEKDSREGLARAAYGQNYVKEAPLDVIICAVYERVTVKYGQRGIRYTDMEAGHAAQNLFLEATALGLVSVPVGAFNDEEVAKLLNLPRDVKPLYILPVGYKK